MSKSELKRIKAKTLVWEEEGHGTDWYDAKCDFHICLEALSYEAAWGEGDPESFATLDEAKQWCQVQIEDWINELAIAPNDTLKRVANIAHLGGLRNLSESAALKEIRKLTENYWDKSATRIISNRG